MSTYQNAVTTLGAIIGSVSGTGSLGSFMTGSMKLPTICQCGGLRGLPSGGPIGSLSGTGMPIGGGFGPGVGILIGGAAGVGVLLSQDTDGESGNIYEDMLRSDADDNSDPNNLEDERGDSGGARPICRGACSGRSIRREEAGASRQEIEEVLVNPNSPRTKGNTGPWFRDEKPSRTIMNKDQPWRSAAVTESEARWRKRLGGK
jgi:hypothetical protein